MASTSETGHIKTVANFEILISRCTGFGTSYNPSKVTIKLPALIALHTDAEDSITAVDVANTATINAVNARKSTFKPLKGLATRIVNALASTDASDELIEDARSINRKIQGTRKGGTTPPETPPTPPDPTSETTHISVSQQSYDNQVENFFRLGKLVESEPTYTPNETDLQLPALIAFHHDLKAKNTAVINANTAAGNARINRNKILYQDKTGLYDIAGEVKKYVMSVFGGSSPEFKNVSKIKFTKPA